MSRLDCKIGVDQKKEHVLLDFVVDGKSTGRGGLSAADIDTLIMGLSRARASLTDGVPDELDPGANPLAIQDPKWRALPVMLPTGYSLDLRHPGFGWIRFVFPQPQAQKIAHYLTSALPPARK
jgi:hypothetical protein